MALAQVKNNKAPGDDGITGRPVLDQLRKLFNTALQNGTTPEARSRSVVILFIKKRSQNAPKNNEQISLPSHVFNMFSRVISNLLARRFEDFQPPQQSGFQTGYSTVNHIHTLRHIVQKTTIALFVLRLWTKKTPSTPSKPGLF